jgi:SAM-dependent MidA family methyltransferase
MSASEPFSAFMQRALYDPQRGYYSARIKTVGARGDFSTSATVSPKLGQGIAKWLIAESKSTSVRTIIEIGGGDGSLMKAVLDGLGWWQRRRFSILMVESSPVLLKQQQERLGRSVNAWFTTLPEALAACEGKALIYHNELLDAFPVDLVQWDGQAWHEVWLRHESSVVEELHPLSSSDDFTALRAHPAKPQRVELHRAVRDWLRDWVPQWHHGSMLTIDYGGDFPALYHRRPRGTLRAYLMQQRLEGADVYANPGRQDITSDVNFTDVRAWLHELGTTELSYESQAAFIGRLAPERGSAADRFVVEFDGAGSAFQCLAVRR